MWLTPKEVEVTGLMISLVSDAYHIAPDTLYIHDTYRIRFLFLDLVVTKENQ